MLKRGLLFVFILSLGFYQASFAQTKITWKQTHIPMTEAGTKGLETLLVWPDDNKKHPLALISHGSPRKASDRKEMTALALLPSAEEFARRGFAVAVVLRRGYGESGGDWAENYGDCQSPDYYHAALAASADLHAAIQYLATLPQFDTNEIIAIGVSAGGFATVALTAINPPPGLLAAISFAGGRGSASNDTVCNPDALIATFATLGKTSRTPMLWVYAQNDHFFNPALAKRFYQAFTENGGDAVFIKANSYNKEGHFLFSTAGIAQWTPLVDKFLKEENLVYVDKLLPLPTHPQLKAPVNLSKNAAQAFASYSKSAPHKAFAVATDGAFGWRTGRPSVATAKTEALNLCRQYSTKTCKIIAVDDAMVP